MIIELSMAQYRVREILKDIADEADGKALRRDLTRNIRAAAEPARAEIQARVMSMGSAGTGEGESLRTAVASRVQIRVRTASRRPGVSIGISSAGMPRGFAKAGRRLDSRQGWRHPVYGNRQVWVSQTGEPGYFTDTVNRHHQEAQQAVIAAVEDMAKRMAGKA